MRMARDMARRLLKMEGGWFPLGQIKYEIEPVAKEICGFGIHSIPFYWTIIQDPLIRTRQVRNQDNRGSYQYVTEARYIGPSRIPTDDSPRRGKKRSWKWNK